MGHESTDTLLIQSCSCFDSQGRLLDWDAGFESEFTAAAGLIKPGALFKEILRLAYESDQVIRVCLPNNHKPEEAINHIDKWPQNIVTNQSFKYWNGNHIINVCEIRTLSRGIIRIASAATTEIQEPKAAAAMPAESGSGESDPTHDDEQDRLLRTAALETSNSILLLRLRTEQKLKALSITDPLTKLANRRHFSEILNSRWQQALQKRTSIGIAIIDIDHFKLYNDHYGHSAGDTCLQEVATALSESMRQGMDLVARYGGEEFAVILPGADNTAALAAAKRACTAVSNLNKPHAATDGIVTVSIGVAAQIPANLNNAQELIDQADAALYQAKALGRNRAVSAFDS